LKQFCHSDHKPDICVNNEKKINIYVKVFYVTNQSRGSSVQSQESWLFQGFWIQLPLMPLSSWPSRKNWWLDKTARKITGPLTLGSCTVKYTLYLLPHMGLHFHVTNIACFFLQYKDMWSRGKTEADSNPCFFIFHEQWHSELIKSHFKIIINHKNKTY